jgi:hypothetical protein
VLLHEPLHDTLVAQHKLPQTLYHAQSLHAEVLHCLSNQVDVVMRDPAAVLYNIILAGLAASVDLHRGGMFVVLRLPLALEHIQDRVHGAECTSTATAGRAVYNHWAAVCGFRLG